MTDADRATAALSLPSSEQLIAAARSAGASRFGTGRVVVHASTGSTQDDVLALADAGAKEGSVVLAGVQTAGRGRRGRTWVSPPGGLFLSILLRPRADFLATVPASLLAGLAVVRAIREVAGVEARLKWPNDVVIDGRKVAGILGEAREPSRDAKRERGSGRLPVDERVVALGIGIDVAVRSDDLPEDVRPIATSLDRERAGAGARPIDATALAAALLAHLEVLLDLAADPSERAALGAALTERLVTIGQQVRVDLGPNQGSFEGVAVRLTAAGALVVLDSATNEERTVLAGDVTHLRPRPSEGSVS